MFGRRSKPSIFRRIFGRRKKSARVNVPNLLTGNRYEPVKVNQNFIKNMESILGERTHTMNLLTGTPYVPRPVRPAPPPPIRRKTPEERTMSFQKSQKILNIAYSEDRLRNRRKQFENWAKNQTTMNILNKTPNALIKNFRVYTIAKNMSNNNRRNFVNWARNKNFGNKSNAQIIENFENPRNINL
jgi:hypothetical protein